MPRKIIALCVSLMFCGCASFQKTNISPIGDWIRTDDEGEYNGVYVYSLTKGGKIFLTNYPEKWPKEKKERVYFGSWLESDGILKWFNKKNKLFTSYKKASGKYREIDGNYYVPVYLKRVELVNGQFKIE